MNNPLNLNVHHYPITCPLVSNPLLSKLNFQTLLSFRRVSQAYSLTFKEWVLANKSFRERTIVQVSFDDIFTSKANPKLFLEIVEDSMRQGGQNYEDDDEREYICTEKKKLAAMAQSKLAFAQDYKLSIALKIRCPGNNSYERMCNFVQLKQTIDDDIKLLISSIYTSNFTPNSTKVDPFFNSIFGHKKFPNLNTMRIETLCPPERFQSSSLLPEKASKHIKYLEILSTEMSTSYQPNYAAILQDHGMNLESLSIGRIKRGTRFEILFEKSCLQDLRVASGLRKFKWTSKFENSPKQLTIGDIQDLINSTKNNKKLFETITTLTIKPIESKDRFVKELKLFELFPRLENFNLDSLDFISCETITLPESIKTIYLPMEAKVSICENDSIHLEWNTDKTFTIQLPSGCLKNVIVNF